MYSYLRERTCTWKHQFSELPPDRPRYIVTPLMWTNLQSLLAKGPIANEFTQYFLYQILVRNIFRAR